jgi:tellurite methyltransferase
MPRGDEEWTAYFDAVAGLPPRETLVFALDRFDAEAQQNRDRKEAGVERFTPVAKRMAPVSGPLAYARGSVGGREVFAVDLGCGEGRDTLELVRRGWRVLAIDSSPEALARLEANVAQVGRGQDGAAAAVLETRLAAFEDTPMPAADLINASFSIPHCSPEDFPRIWERIVGAIRPGGRFAGQFFGVNDSWATKPDGVTRTYHTRAQVDAMLAPFEVEKLEEIERPGKTALGEPKYWHVFHVVARKR